MLNFLANMLTHGKDKLFMTYYPSHKTIFLQIYGNYTYFSHKRISITKVHVYYNPMAKLFIL